MVLPDFSLQTFPPEIIALLTPSAMPNTHPQIETNLPWPSMSQFTFVLTLCIGARHSQNILQLICFLLLTFVLANKKMFALEIV